MGAIGGLLGTSGGASGTGFSGPSKVDIQQPVTQGQVNAGQTGATNSLDSSDALLKALKGAGGVGNQSQVYGQGQDFYKQLAENNGVGVQAGATGKQQDLTNTIGSANGVGIQTGAVSGLNDVLKLQKGTVNQLQGIANGTGPNPAQAMLNQATGQNVANQAALMAGQRGAGSNVGLMARQAAQQGAGIQQQAVGQGATMQANQQLGAINALTGAEQGMGSTNSTIAGIGSGLTGAEQNAINSQFGQGATTVGEQQGQFGANAGVAQNQVGNQVGATGTNMQGHISNAGQLIGGMGQYNSTQAGQQGNVNNANTSLATTGMKGQQDLLGGVMNAAGPAAAAALAGGGDPATAPVVAAPAPIAPAAPVVAPPPGPTSAFGQFLAGWGKKPAASGQDSKEDDKAPTMGNSALYKGASNFGKGIRAGLNTPDAPGPQLAGPDMSDVSGDTMMAARGGGVVKASSPKEKAVAAGNSYSNDKIPAVLSEGEVIIPRSVMQSKDPARSAADFVAKVMAKRGRAS